MTTNIKHHDPREEYQVATINLLEEIPLQYIRERSFVSHSDDPEQYEILEKKKVHAQNTLNRLGCTLVAQNLLSSPRRQIFEAALKLLIALLEGGNKNVQVCGKKHCQSTYILINVRCRTTWRNTFTVLGMAKLLIFKCCT